MKGYEYDEINNDLDIPGVWALWGKDKKTSKKTCLEVAQTENISVSYTHLTLPTT